MPILANFSFARMEDGTLTIALQPPTNIGGWSIYFNLNKRFGGDSNYMQRYLASGYNGTSGISVISSGTGIFSIPINSIDTSGLDYGNYAGQCWRMDSGHITVLSEGYLILTP